MRVDPAFERLQALIDQKQRLIDRPLPARTSAASAAGAATGTIGRSGNPRFAEAAARARAALAVQSYTPAAEVRPVMVARTAVVAAMPPRLSNVRPPHLGGSIDTYA